MGWGYRRKVTRDLFLKFARQVEQCNTDHPTLRKQSKLLVNELKDICSLHSDATFLEEISEIRFLVSDGVNEDLQTLHEPAVKRGCLMNYATAVTSSSRDLCWTILSILPTYAQLPEKCIYCEKYVRKYLGTGNDPMLQLSWNTPRICVSQ